MPRKRLVEILEEVRQLEKNVYTLMKKRAGGKEMKKEIRELLFIFPMHPIANYLLAHYL